MKSKNKLKVEVKSVSKKFRHRIKNESMLGFVLKLFSFKKKERKEFYGVRDVSFSLKAGENLGIIGRNGSGKSTLLRVIAGIYQPDKGEVKTTGKVVYLTGFGQGINQKLTMRENVFLIGSLMGLSRKEIKERFEEIVEFSGLREYVDVKVQEFSSGMVGRLSFSTGLFCLKHQNPDVLLIDEVGPGGDIDFQEKTKDKMNELVKGGASVILVSHSLSSIKENCDKVIWLENGVAVMAGNPDKVIGVYQESAKKARKNKLNNKK